MSDSTDEPRPEDEPVSARYEWTPELMAEGLAAHTRHATTRARRVVVFLVVAIYFVGSIAIPAALIVSSSTLPETRHSAATALAIIAPAWAGLFYASRKRLYLKWSCRRAFKSLPGGKTAVDWSLGPDQLSNRTGLSAATFLWPAFLKVVESPGGFLLYQSDRFFNYIPAHAFVSAREMGRFVEMARVLASRYIVLGTCPYAGKPEPIEADDL